MKIVVCLKQVPDTEARIRVAGDGRSVETGELKYVVNPYDEFAVEEALRLREKDGGTVTVVCLGPERARLAIRDALAMGADQGVLVKETRENRGAWATAKALAEVLRGMEYDLILFGKQAVDLDNSQVPVRVAELLDLPSVTAVSQLNMEGAVLTLRREVEGGTAVVECKLPAAITAEKGLNEPRYASLKGIMAAKKKTIEDRDPGEFADKVQIVSLRPPPERSGGRIVGEGAEAVPELLRALREEAKII